MSSRPNSLFESIKIRRVDFEDGEVRDPQKWTFWTKKSGLFEPHPYNPLTKTSFLTHFVAKSEPSGRFGVVCCTLAMDLKESFGIFYFIGLAYNVFHV